MVPNKQSYCIHGNCGHSVPKYDSLMVMMVDTPDSFARTSFVYPKLLNLECTSREGWSVAYYTLQRNPIVESHNDRMVGSGLDDIVEHCDGKLLSVRDSIRVGKDIQLTAGFELAAVYIERNVRAALNAGKSMMEPNSVAGKIFLVQLLNVVHEVEGFLLQELNVSM